MTTWPAVLGGLLQGRDLTGGQAGWAMGQVLAGEATPAQVAAFVVALRAKGETAPEVSALVEAMLDHGVALVPATGDRVLVDTCGTGGDGSGSVNVSTMAAVLVAACGELVVKHGNRGASSPTGSADVLEALGLPLDLGPAEVARCVEEVGIGFCFAPTFHPAMRHAGPTRREIGVRTVFNVLGPLANPARAAAQVVGLGDAALAPLVAGVLAVRGSSALVVHGSDGLDEVSTCGPTRVWQVVGGAVTEEVVVTPEDLGLPRGTLADLHGGDPADNAAVVREVLAGAGGPVAHSVVANAAAALVAAGGARGERGPLVPRWAAEVERAGQVLAGGQALALLDRWVALAGELRVAGASGTAS